MADEKADTIEPELVLSRLHRRASHVRMAVDEFPRAVDFAENLGDANPHVRRLRHLAKLYRRNLKPGPESQIGTDALVQYIEPRCTVWVKCVGVIEKTARDRLRARHHVALRTEERRIAFVRDQRVE
jgi:hypothetical protein